MTRKPPAPLLTFTDSFLAEVKNRLEELSREQLNSHLEELIGITGFLPADSSKKELQDFLATGSVSPPPSLGMGDHQTPLNLSVAVCRLLREEGLDPHVVIEPTCGEGSFIMAAIAEFPRLRYVYGVDLQERHMWRLKLSLWQLALTNRLNLKAEFYCDDIFTHRFSPALRERVRDPEMSVLIIGNPPWVTTAAMTRAGMNNVPAKSNIGQLRGMDAMTGKGMFDIAEAVIGVALKEFGGRSGTLAMLCKESTAATLVRSRCAPIAGVRFLRIDSKKSFKIGASAGLCLAELGRTENESCTIARFEQPHQPVIRFGWSENRWVADMDRYQQCRRLDGRFPWAWRQGIKHDAAAVMVVERVAEGWRNGFGETVEIEHELLYPLVRGHEVQALLIAGTAKHVIVTQRTLNQDTAPLALQQPQLWSYLQRYGHMLDGRRSRVYRGRPRFAMFGVGEYAFSPYKVAVCGFHREPRFALALPVETKAAIPDDTCYYLAFEERSDAVFTWLLLNAEPVKELLATITFCNAKRMVTKEVLMRIDLPAVIRESDFGALREQFMRSPARGLVDDVTKAGYRAFAAKVRGAE